MTQRTLVLLPGLDGTGDLFGPLLDVVPAGVGTRVMAYPVDRSLSYAELLGLVEDRLRAEPELVLVAESFSGPLALRFAAAHPGRVRAVVLCASFVRTPVPRWLGRLVKPMLFRIPPPTLAVRHFLVGRDAPDPLVRAVKAAIGRVRPEVLACRLRDVFEVECADALRSCPAPVLYLRAARDALVRRSSVAAIQAVRPGVSVRTVDGPHLLLQREPAAAWREIAGFLTQARVCGGTGE